MCGRYVLKLNSSILAAEIGFDADLPFSGSTNIAPSETVPVLLNENEKEVWRLAKWGFTTGWSSGPKFLINLKSETILEKRFAKNALTSGRCILPANGFFEWRSDGKRKLPVYFTRTDESLLGIAGLMFRSKEGEEQCIILTTEANELVSNVHSRMPVLFSKEDWKRWVLEKDPVLALALARPFPAEEMRGWYVDQKFSNARYKGDLQTSEEFKFQAVVN